MKVTMVIFNFTKIWILCVSFFSFLLPSAHAEGLSNISPEIMNYGMIPLVFFVMYFLVIRPQNKKAKLHQQMLTALRRGDQVLTAGGIIGIVQKVDNDQEIQVEIAEGIRVRVAKTTIAQVFAKTEPLKTSNLDVSSNHTIIQNEVKDFDVDKNETRIVPKSTTQSRKKTTKPK